MRKLWLAILALISATKLCAAGVPCGPAFNLQNGTPADATQVMANFQAIYNCLAAAAAAGTNSDITTLNGLLTPLPPSNGGTPLFFGGVATGSSSSLIVNPVTPSVFSPQAGYMVNFGVNSTNSGPVDVTVGSAPPIHLYRRTQVGISPLVGGELVSGQRITMIYDGVQYQLLAGPYLVGQIVDYAGSTPPLGWAFADGSCQPRVGVLTDLFNLIGAGFDTLGACDPAHFALPDGRGRMLAGRDNMGVGPANILVPPSCAGSVVGTLCGAVGSGSMLTAANLPNITVQGGSTLGLANTGLSVSDSGHSHGVTDNHTHNFTAVQVGGGPVYSTSPALAGLQSVPATTTGTNSGTAISVNSSNANVSGTVISGTVNGIIVPRTGAQTALTASLPPLMIINKMIKY
jgi:hypothetical protein